MGRFTSRVKPAAACWLKRIYEQSSCRCRTFQHAFTPAIVTAATAMAAGIGRIPSLSRTRAAAVTAHLALRRCYRKCAIIFIDIGGTRSILRVGVPQAGGIWTVTCARVTPHSDDAPVLKPIPVVCSEGHTTASRRPKTTDRRARSCAACKQDALRRAGVEAVTRDPGSPVRIRA